LKEATNKDRAAVLFLGLKNDWKGGNSAKGGRGQGNVTGGLIGDWPVCVENWDLLFFISGQDLGGGKEVPGAKGMHKKTALRQQNMKPD